MWMLAPRPAARPLARDGTHSHRPLSTHLHACLWISTYGDEVRPRPRKISTHSQESVSVTRPHAISWRCSARLSAWSMAMSARMASTQRLFRTLSSGRHPPCKVGWGPLYRSMGHAGNNCASTAPMTGTVHALPAPLITSTLPMDNARCGGNPCKVRCSMGCSRRETCSPPPSQWRTHIQSWPARNVGTFPSTLRLTLHR